MGITGLIPFLEKASSRVQLKDIRGCTVAVDTYCWLHKGVFSCADKLARGEDSDQYVQYCLKYVHLLLSHDIKPILVFDGGHLPAKALTERRRRESRQQSKKLAAELLREGRIEEARSHMRRCVDVTHEMALRLIRECRQRNVDCIVAPYEADAQMAWLNKVDLAQYVITEDSDLTLFGAKKVIFKLDLTGVGLLVEADKLYLAMGCRQEKYNFDKFRRMCILSGCDYLDSLPGIGLAKACKFFLKTEEDNMWNALKKIPQYLNMRNLEVDDEYIDSFLKADATFKHMYIYNPLKRKMERLNEIDEFNTDERYCSNAGILLENNEQAFQLALGNINPFTLKQLDNWHPDKNFGLAQATTNHNIKRAKHKSIWQTNFHPHSLDKKENSTRATTSSCALYFKKVDFISKTLGEEINASFKEECAKPEESEIFTMYNEANEHEAPQTKRQRFNDSISTSSSDERKSPPASPEAATKARHNPFAKACIPRATSPKKSPLICENSSLLKALSPRKLKEGMMQRITRVNSIKRSIFTVDDESAQQKVEVKSRLFASNLKQVTARQTPPLPMPDFSEEISRIESLSQQNQANIAQLYNSPSPIKNTASKEIPLSHTDSGIESITTDNTNETELREEIDELGASCTNVINAFQADRESNKSIDEATIISSDDDDKISTQSSNAFSIRLSQFSAVKPQTKAPRLGLTKPKTKSSTTAKRSSTKSTKIANNAATFSQNQTRLSMFGFQKRPNLK